MFATDAVSFELADVEEPEVDRLAVGFELEAHEVVVGVAAELDLVDEEVVAVESADWHDVVLFEVVEQRFVEAHQFVVAVEWRAGEADRFVLGVVGEGGEDADPVVGGFGVESGGGRCGLET